MLKYYVMKIAILNSDILCCGELLMFILIADSWHKGSLLMSLNLNNEVVPIDDLS